MGWIIFFAIVLGLFGSLGSGHRRYYRDDQQSYPEPEYDYDSSNSGDCGGCSDE
jgi:hypothetical protein